MITSSAIFYLTDCKGLFRRHRLQRKTSQLPLVNPERFKNCFINRICLNYNVAISFFFTIVTNLVPRALFPGFSKAREMRLGTRLN